MYKPKNLKYNESRTETFKNPAEYLFEHKHCVDRDIHENYHLISSKDKSLCTTDKITLRGILSGASEPFIKLLCQVRIKLYHFLS